MTSLSVIVYTVKYVQLYIRVDEDNMSIIYSSLLYLIHEFSCYNTGTQHIDLPRNNFEALLTHPYIKHIPPVFSIAS